VESKDPRDYDNTEINLYSSVLGPVAIESGVKKQILTLLAVRDYSFDELVRVTEKAKSTISVHIRDLEDDGLISSHPDPEDNRKKIISLSSKPIGVLTRRDREAADDEIQRDKISFPFTPGDIPSFFRFAVKVFRTEAMLMGINIDPILFQCGLRVGSVISLLIIDWDLDLLVGKVNEFWETYGLGSVELTGVDPLLLTVKGCFECEDLPKTGHGACSFDTGVLTAVFSRYFQSPVLVTEEECYSSGYDHCLFVIKKRD